MRRSMIGFLGVSILLLQTHALAAPVTFDKSEAVAEARRDPGTGFCGVVMKFAPPASPLMTIAEAVALLNKPDGSPEVVARVRRIFSNMNFSVGAGSEADFRAPAFDDAIFPHCQDSMAMPPGADDNNLAMRLRGYLNITSTRSGQPQTFAVRCDDACIVKIGKSQKVVVQADVGSSPDGRRARWVAFTDPGLYPVEVVYYQNSTSGSFEWSNSFGSVFASDDVAVDNVAWGQQMGNFKPLLSTDLYSSIIGSNSTCTECGLPGMDCAGGSYCGEGLCQLCNQPDHCGATCQRCPIERHICSAGKCAQCTSDTECLPGHFCDIASGTCFPPTPCTGNAQCLAPRICLADGFCRLPPPPCHQDSECLAEQYCDAQQRICCSVQGCGLYMPPPPTSATGCSVSGGHDEDRKRSLSAGLAMLFGMAAFLALRSRSRVAMFGRRIP